MSNTDTAAQMRKMAEAAQSAVVDNSGGSEQFAATARMLRAGADALDALAEAQQEIARLTAENAVLVKAVEFAYEADLPEDECTTASMLYRIALQWDTLVDIANAYTNESGFVVERVKEIAQYQWPDGFRRRADFIEKRDRREYIAEAALTAERQKVRELREWLVAEEARKREKGRGADDAASAIAYEATLDTCDALGLTGAQP